MPKAFLRWLVRIPPLPRLEGPLAYRLGPVFLHMLSWPFAIGLLPLFDLLAVAGIVIGVFAVVGFFGIFMAGYIAAVVAIVAAVVLAYILLSAAVLRMASAISHNWQERRRKALWQARLLALPVAAVSMLYLVLNLALFGTPDGSSVQSTVIGVAFFGLLAASSLGLLAMTLLPGTTRVFGQDRPVSGT